MLRGKSYWVLTDRAERQAVGVACLLGAALVGAVALSAKK